MAKINKSNYAHHDILDGDACIYKRHDNGSSFWQFRMWIKDEKKYLKTSLKTTDFDSAFSIAKKKAIELITDIKSGKQIYSITLQELIDLYLEHREKDIDKTTGITRGRLKSIKSQLSYFLKMKGADTMVNTLDRKCMYDYPLLRKKLHNAKYGTSKNEGTTINAMWSWAYNEGHTHFKKFEFKKIVIKNNEIGRRDTFTDDEYGKLCRYMRSWVLKKNCMTRPTVRDGKSGKYTSGKLCFDQQLQLERQMVRDYILISANTGLRVGEARQLKWGDVERIEEHIIDEATEEKQLLVKLKVRWETSKVRLPREFLSRGGEYFVRLNERQQFTEPHHLVFSMDGKNSLTSARWTTHWTSLMKHTGIKDWKKEYLKDENGNFVLDDEGNSIQSGRNLTYYSLRHFQITSRVKSGVPLVDISKQVGTSIGHIEKTYLHYEEEQSRTNALKTYTKENGMTIPLNKISEKKIA